MRLLVLGATGGLGLALVEQALANGHEVTAFVRNPDTFQPKHENLKVVKGNIFDVAAVESAVHGQEAVLSAVGAKTKLRQTTTIYSQGGANVVSAMEKQGVRRLIWITSAAVDAEDLAATGFVYSKIIAPLFFEGIYADALASEQILRKSTLDWIIVRPTRLTKGAYLGVYRVDAQHSPSNGKSISRADVADFMLKNLTDVTYVHKTPALAY